ncbi:Mercuric reductase [Aquisphaera giovannonii]|uniref:Mercuric reductase n=1 Tax=Aquisphaera giovannonii TaxID=406548 RepID=A0A5B9WEN4_9BACT|nr:FAD-dependent oxidoreductase [Aquisphaera giovannonii]QEH39007.1 Mercuric reductase [Aquisphaera giovannonii]
MSIENCQNLVIGSGVGGKLLAWTLARRGERTVVVERSMVGGSCPNVACLPSKNVIYSAKAVSLVDPDTGLGVVTGPVRVDMAGVARRKRRMVDELVERHLDNFKASGVELVMGEARFTGPKTVRVEQNAGGVRSLRGERVFINVGTRAAIPDVPGLALAGPMTHVEALDLERLPERLVVLGGGYVGLEFAQAMRRFGSRVTIVQRGARILDREDPDVANALRELMEDEGIEVLLRSELLAVEGVSGAGVRLRVRSGAGERTLEASDILVAAGRTPNTDQLDADRAGVELDARGYIRVNDRLQTSAPDVWATGECAGSPQFTHVGEDDFRVVLDNLAGGSRTTRGRLIPYCLFTDPELAHVGLNESEALAAGVSYRIARMPMAKVLRTYTLSQPRGFMKALIGADDRILGFTAFGAEASETMAVAQTAMLGGLPYTALRDAIFTHPTAAEGLLGLFADPPVAPAP